jgi:hypothetical protein
VATLPRACASVSAARRREWRRPLEWSSPCGSREERDEVVGLQTPPPQECASGDDLPHLQLTLRRLLEPLQWLQHLQNPVAARVAEAPGDSLAKRALLLPCSSSLTVAGCRAARSARSGILCSVGQRFCSDFGQSPFVLVRKSRKIFFRSGPSVPRAM